MTSRSWRGSALLPVAFVAAACSSTSIDMEITLVDYGIIAPQTIEAGEVDFRVFVDGVAHHTLTFCPASDIGACDGEAVRVAYTRLPEDARDPSVIPTETNAIVLGAGWDADFRVSLEPGTYRLYCSIVNHTAYGMDRLLEVTAPA